MDRKRSNQSTGEQDTNMNGERLKAAILDMDGVITRTARVHARAWKQMFDEYLRQREDRDGLPQEPFDIDRDYRRYVDGKPRYDGVKSFLESRAIALPFGEVDDPPTRETVCGLGNRKNEVFHQMLKSGVEVYEDTIEQVGNWKRDGIKVAVISSSRNCEAVLKAAGLLDLFDARVDGNDLSRHGMKGKPAPDMFLHAASKLGVEPGEAMVIEDAIAGVEAGREGRFGLVVGVARNREGDDLRQAGADLVVRDLRELRTASDCPHRGECLETPSAALDRSDWIAGRIKGKELALFLDYDGTLTPIVRRPEDATLTDEMRSLLSELSGRCTVAIVSGRDRRNAEEMVRLDNLVFAGSHGFDIRGPGGLEMQPEGAQRALPDLDEAERELHQRIDAIEGARVERKKFAIAVHYREVSSEAETRQVEKAVDEVLGKHSGLRKRGGKKIFELQPNLDWDKGKAVLWLTEALGLNHSGVVVIYIGDDVTDEDAFRVLRNSGAGIGIRVAAPASGTHACYYLRDCDEVEQFLQSLLVMLPEKKA
jgi:trehalose-phosphatase